MTRAQKTLAAVRRLCSEDLEQTTDEQIRQELIEDGLDPDKVASDVKDTIQCVVRKFIERSQFLSHPTAIRKDWKYWMEVGRSDWENGTKRAPLGSWQAVAWKTGFDAAYDKERPRLDIDAQSQGGTDS